MHGGQVRKRKNPRENKIIVTYSKIDSPDWERGKWAHFTQKTRSLAPLLRLCRYRGKRNNRAHFPHLRDAHVGDDLAHDLRVHRGPQAFADLVVNTRQRVAERLHPAVDRAAAPEPSVRGQGVRGEREGWFVSCFPRIFTRWVVRANGAKGTFCRPTHSMEEILQLNARGRLRWIVLGRKEKISAFPSTHKPSLRAK